MTKFPKAWRLRKRRDFLLVQSARIRIKTPYFVLIFRPIDRGTCRAGFTVTKKLGNAVARNRIKRRLRAAVRLAPAFARVRGDVVLVAYSAALRAPWPALVAAVNQALETVAARPAAVPKRLA